MNLNDSTEGRWLTPDLLGLPAQAGGDITNPQSLNRYAYALNNPTTLTDPSGLTACNEFNTSYEGSGSPPTWCSQPNAPPIWDPFGVLILGGGGGGGGGSASGSTTANGPGAPPTIGGGVSGLPPGVGNAFLGFHFFCSQTTTFPGGITSPIGCELYFLGLRLGTTQLLGSLAGATFIAGSVTASVPIGAIPIGVGPTVNFAFNPSTHAACVGGGVAATIPPGKTFNVGPLIHGNLSEVPSILNGLSYSSNVQLNPFVGYQALWNSTGFVGGPTVGFFGGSLAVTYSGCGHY